MRVPRKIFIRVTDKKNFTRPISGNKATFSGLSVVVNA